MRVVAGKLTEFWLYIELSLGRKKGVTVFALSNCKNEVTIFRKEKEH
jgi:hypothetical protein